MTKHLDQARKTATRSKHPQHFMGCVITRGGSVISRAHNLGPGLGHAEARALRPHQDFTGCDLFVVRLNGRRTSKPCAKCAEMIKSAGIETVTYVNDVGQLITLKSELL